MRYWFFAQAWPTAHMLDQLSKVWGESYSRIFRYFDGRPKMGKNGVISYTLPPPARVFSNWSLGNCESVGPPDSRN